MLTGSRTMKDRPVCCTLCRKQWPSLSGAQSSPHSCNVMSCMFQRFSVSSATKTQTCTYCLQEVAAYQEHLADVHKFRDCAQELYSNRDDFLRHLIDAHAFSAFGAFGLAQLPAELQGPPLSPKFEPVDHHGRPAVPSLEGYGVIEPAHCVRALPQKGSLVPHSLASAGTPTSASDSDLSVKANSHLDPKKRHDWWKPLKRMRQKVL
jgi:hypothetical protein